MRASSRSFRAAATVKLLWPRRRARRCTGGKCGTDTLAGRCMTASAVPTAALATTPCVLRCHTAGRTLTLTLAPTLTLTLTPTPTLTLTLTRSHAIASDAIHREVLG